MYIYYLSHGFIPSTRAFNLLTHFFNLATLAFSHLTRAFDFVTRELNSQLVELNSQLVDFNSELLDLNSKLQLVNRVLPFHIQNCLLIFPGNILLRLTNPIAPAVHKFTNSSLQTVCSSKWQSVSASVISGIQHRSGIIKTSISNHFPIVFALNTCEKSKPTRHNLFISAFTEKNK